MKFRFFKNIFSILKTKTNKYSQFIKGLHHSVQRFKDGKITKARENSEPGNFLTEYHNITRFIKLYKIVKVLDYEFRSDINSISSREKGFFFQCRGLMYFYVFSRNYLTIYSFLQLWVV